MCVIVVFFLESLCRSFVVVMNFVNKLHLLKGRSKDTSSNGWGEILLGEQFCTRINETIFFTTAKQAGDVERVPCKWNISQRAERLGLEYENVCMSRALQCLIII